MELLRTGGALIAEWTRVAERVQYWWKETVVREPCVTYRTNSFTYCIPNMVPRVLSGVSEPKLCMDFSFYQWSSNDHLFSSAIKLGEESVGLTSYTFIRQVADSNRGQGTGYPDRDFPGILPVHLRKCWNNARILPNPLQLIIHQCSYHSTLNNLRCWQRH
jgi:hypothetical protein